MFWARAESDNGAGELIAAHVREERRVRRHVHQDQDRLGMPVGVGVDSDEDIMRRGQLGEGDGADDVSRAY